MAQIGTAFQVNGAGNHLWVVISAPIVDGKVVCVNITDANNYPESTCRLAVGDHEFITKPSVMMYKKAKLWRDAYIDSSIISGQINQHPNVRREIMARIIDGAFRSDDIAPYLLAYIKPL